MVVKSELCMVWTVRSCTITIAKTCRLALILLIITYLFFVSTLHTLWRPQNPESSEVWEVRSYKCWNTRYLRVYIKIVTTYFPNKHTHTHTDRGHWQRHKVVLPSPCNDDSLLFHVLLSAVTTLHTIFRIYRQAVDVLVYRHWKRHTQSCFAASPRHGASSCIVRYGDGQRRWGTARAGLRRWGQLRASVELWQRWHLGIRFSLNWTVPASEAQGKSVGVGNYKARAAMVEHL